MDRKRLRFLSADPALIEQTEYHARRFAKMGVPVHEVLRGLRAEGRGELEVRDVGVVLNRCYYEVRESEARVLEDLFRSELESRTLPETLSKFTKAIQSYARADEAGIWFPAAVTGRLKRAISFQVGAEDRRLLVPSWRVRTCWSVPLGSSGILQLGFRKDYPWLAREKDLLLIAAERCLAAAEKARLIEELAAREAEIRRLSHSLLEIEERERRRISRELHDEAGQSLLCIRLNLEMLEADLGPDSPLAPKVRETRELADRTVSEIRRILSALNPEVLERLGLGAAIRQLGQRFAGASPARIQVAVGALPPLEEKLTLLMYRLAQECVTNAVKHANATTIKIHLDSADTTLRLKVEDDGNGFPLEHGFHKQGSYGLTGMKERVALFGGVCAIESRVLQEGWARKRNGHRHGTSIEIKIPIRNE